MRSRDRTRFDQHLQRVERLGLTEAEDVLELCGLLGVEEPVRLNHATLQAHWRQRARDLSPLAGDRQRIERVSLLVGIPAPSRSPASNAAEPGAQARLSDLHRQISWYGAGLLECELSAAQLTGAGLAALPANRLERLVHHMFLAFSWRGDALWTAYPGEARASDLERRLARLGIRIVSQTAHLSAGSTDRRPIPDNVLALGEGTEGLLWGRWRYMLREYDEAVTAAEQRGVAAPRGFIEARRHEPVLECRRHLVEALARGPVDPQHLQRSFPQPVLQAVEPNLSALEELGQLARSPAEWALRDSSPSRRTAALLFLAEIEPDPPEPPPEARRGTEVRLLLHVGRERIPVVVLRRTASGDYAGEEGDFAFFYPEDVLWERERPARRTLRQLFQELFPAVVRRYQPESVELLAQRLVTATRRLAASRGDSGNAIPLRLSLQPLEVAPGDPPSTSDPCGGATSAPPEITQPSLEPPVRFVPRLGIGMKPSLIVSASNRCNLKCRFCLERGRRIPDLPDLQVLLDALGAIDPESINHVVFMSGETLLRRDVERLLAETRALGFCLIALATNGTLLRNRAQLDDLIEAGLSGLELSVHTLDANRAAFISGRSSTAERVRRSLALLNDVCAERPFGCFINIVICQLTVPDVAGLVEIIERDYPAIQPRFVLKFPRCLDGFDRSLAPATLQQLRDSDIPALLAPRSGRTIEAVDFPLCALTPHHAASMNLVSFAAGGLCVDLKPGTPPRAVYEKVLPSDLNVFAPPCETCSTRMLCCGVEARYLEITGSDHGCLPLTRSPEEILTEAVQASRYLAPTGSPVEAAGLANVIGFLTDCWDARRSR